MYIIKANNFSLENWLNESSKDASIFNALKNKNYDIFISFNQNNETIKYEAVIKTDVQNVTGSIDVEIVTGIFDSRLDSL